MIINGKVTSGTGKGAFFLSQEFYSSQFNEKCGFKPFPGTLNIIVDEKYIYDVKKIKESCNQIIKPNKGFGQVNYIKTILNDEVTGAIVFPEKTIHDVNYLEFISKEKLRDKLNLKDGDVVKLEINI